MNFGTTLSNPPSEQVLRHAETVLRAWGLWFRVSETVVCRLVRCLDRCCHCLDRRDSRSGSSPRHRSTVTCGITKQRKFSVGGTDKNFHTKSRNFSRCSFGPMRLRKCVMEQALSSAETYVGQEVPPTRGRGRRGRTGNPSGARQRPMGRNLAPIGGSSVETPVLHARRQTLPLLTPLYGPARGQGSARQRLSLKQMARSVHFRAAPQTTADEDGTPNGHDCNPTSPVRVDEPSTTAHVADQREASPASPRTAAMVTAETREGFFTPVAQRSTIQPERRCPRITRARHKSRALNSVVAHEDPIEIEDITAIE